MQLKWILSTGGGIIAYFIWGHLLGAIGFGVFLFIFLEYVEALGRNIPMMELIALIAAAQWLLGAFLAYRLNFDHWRYYMYVDEDVYMSLAMPGVLAFRYGLYYFKSSIDLNTLFEKLSFYANSHQRLAYGLLLLGLISTQLSPFFPASLGFAFYILSNFKFVGAIMILFSQNDKKWFTVLLVMGLLFLDSLRGGLFHDLVLWSAILISFISLQLNWTFRFKILLLSAGVFSLFIIQGVKGNYRSSVGDYVDTSDRIALFSDLVASNIANLETLLVDSYYGIMNVRLNQGWIISAIVYHIPTSSDYIHGETIKEAVYSSIVPRFLDADKKEAGGRDNFRRFTGLEIREGTSMGTSVLGEAYGNFGLEGAWLFMFIWGFLLSWIFKELLLYGYVHPIMVAFIPLIFLQAIKAETELAVMLNHLVKSLLFVFAFLWFSRNVLGWRL